LSQIDEIRSCFFIFIGIQQLFSHRQLPICVTYVIKSLTLLFMLSHILHCNPNTNKHYLSYATELPFIFNVEVSSELPSLHHTADCNYLYFTVNSSTHSLKRNKS